MTDNIAKQLAGLGIEQSRIDVEDFAVFRHAKLADLLDGFMAKNPGLPVPLEGITVVRRPAGAGWLVLRKEIEQSVEGIRRFAIGYNVEIELTLYVEDIDLDVLLSIAGHVRHGLIDRLRLFYSYPAPDDGSIAALRRSLVAATREPALSDPRIRFGDFPFCLFPASAFSWLYRDAMDELLGRIEAQRALLASLPDNQWGDEFRLVREHVVPPVPDPCRGCRCRRACHAYTRVGESPGLEPFLRPRGGSVVAFAGASMPPEARPDDPAIVWAGPARQGDMVAAVLDGFSTILLIDGYFYNRFPCTTAEVLLAMDHGVRVCGSSSLGALRALELEPYGMKGYGRVFEKLKSLPVKPYHLVAQVYDMHDRAQTVPLVQILHMLELARKDGILNEAQKALCEKVAEGIHFTQLRWEKYREALREEPGMEDGIAERLLEYVGDNSAGDLKRQDAITMLESYPRSAHRDRVAQSAREHGHRVLAGLLERCEKTGDLRLPAGVRERWEAHDTFQTGESAAPSRDLRAVPAKQTCKRSARFFEGLDVTVADTTYYDPGHTFIISTFLPALYYLDYYPCSGTGNGTVLDDALASAYMELVERVSACAAHVVGSREPEARPIAPEMLPAFYNRGGDGIRDAAASEGYVTVTDIAGGSDYAVPRPAVAFHHSGSDGFAAGNTRSEVALYGLYETLERDTCQIYVSDQDCRARSRGFKLDPATAADDATRAVLNAAEAKGCLMLLFALPNVFDLPCVMCAVYDHNRRVQLHGGVAVRTGLHAAARAAVHEAYMQYITYFVGTRDDYQAFTHDKQARAAYAYARETCFEREPITLPWQPESGLETLESELAFVMRRVGDAGLEKILFADLSPREEYGLFAGRIIVPGTELWFCPEYRISPFFAGRAQATRRKCGDLDRQL